MQKTRYFLIRAAAAAGLMFCLALSGFAAEDEEQSPELALFADGSYCFAGTEFSGEETPDGVFLTRLPEGARLLLGTRELRAGDVLPGSELSRLELRPTASGDTVTTLCFLPVYDGRAAEESTLTMHIHSADEAPVALDQELETWCNLPNTGRLRTGREAEGLVFTLKNRPTRGTVELRADGSFTYTPKKNKVGEDSFTFTVTDANGRVSEPGTVRITILRPQDRETFADLDRDGQFTAIWLREAGLFGGERISERLSFGPDRTVSRGEFLAMVMDLEGIAPDLGLQASGFDDEADAPAWLRPYLASAMRRGLARGYRTEDGLEFRANQPITGAEAEAILRRALRLEGAVPVSAMNDGSVPAWARSDAAALAEAGLSLPEPNAALTRQQAADLLYQVSKLP